MTSLTDNTQAILLLTAPLITGPRDSAAHLLTPSEYNRLTRTLREKQKQPADLIGPNASEMLACCASFFGQNRLESLLGRGFLLSQALDRWSSRAMWVMSRADAAYPRRLKARLKEDAPPVLYGCGDLALLESGGLAIVGSRHVDDDAMAYTEEVGRLAASAHKTVVSGGAKGIDRAAMHGALQAGGTVVGVMADSLERAVLARDNREPLMDQRLVLVSPYDPSAGFNVGHAMQRNKVIYALSDAALVVTSDFEKGGTWTGAIEQLEKLHLVPVFVRNGSYAGKGNMALLQHGARAWPNPTDKSEFADTLASALETTNAEPQQATIAFTPLKENSSAEPLSSPQIFSLPSETDSSSEKSVKSPREILSHELVEPQTEAGIMELLAISRKEAKALLKQLVLDGVLEKLSKPVRYSVVKNGDRLL